MPAKIDTFIEPNIITLQQALEIALQHLQEGELSKAERIYERVIHVNPNQLQALHFLGTIALHRGHNEKAVKFFKKAVTIEPEFAEAHNNLGVAYKGLGRKKEALKHYKKAVAINPQYAVAHNNIGVISQEVGQIDEALTSCQKAIELNPNYFEAHNNLGNVFQETGRTEEAIASYKNALTINPDYAEAHCNMGIVENKLGNCDQAVISYQKAITLKPDYADAHFNLGIQFLELTRLDEAEVNLRNALTINPDYADAHNNLGLVLTEQGKLEEAVASYQEALKLKPDFAGAYSNLGGAYIQIGKVDEAISCLQKAISIEPGSPAIQHRLDSLLGNITDCAPRRYVEEVFNSYANKFDDHLVNKLKYKTPALLKGSFRDLGWGEKKYKNAIDLGCGTGLSGFEFRDITETLVGIDLSENMINKAKTKNIYDELYVDDIIPRLNVLNTKFDLFISCDVFVYIGDLVPIFNCVREYSNQNSVFTFSTEHTDETDFVLRDSARYAHSKDYVLSVASKSGFECELFTESNLRYEKNNWIIGGIYVLNCV